MTDDDPLQNLERLARAHIRKPLANCNLGDLARLRTQATPEDRVYVDWMRDNVRAAMPSTEEER